MRRRIPQLDLLRAVAIVLVLFHHSVTRWTEQTPLLPRALFEVGYSGVDLFFVLSGFLVSGLLFKEHQTHGHLRVGRFLARRAFKIWPAYYAYLALVLVLVWRTGQDLSQTWPLIVQVQNYVSVDVATHTWSLAVEEHFYLLLPPVLVLALRDGRGRAVPWIAGALAVACFAMRWASDVEVPTEPTHLRLDSLFLGVTLGWLQHLHPQTFAAWTRPAGWWLVLGPLLVAGAHVPWGVAPALQNAAIPSVVAVGYALVLLGALGADQWPAVKGWLETSPVARGIAFAGEHSYSVYLWHVDLGLRLVWLAAAGLGVSLTNPTLLGWGVAVIIYTFVAFGVGILMSRGIEMPMLALRERWLGDGSARAD